MGRNSQERSASVRTLDPVLLATPEGLDENPAKPGRLSLPKPSSHARTPDGAMAESE